MKIAIYARKSKMSDKGESIDNQMNTCKDYISRWSSHATDEIEFVVYKDEGFSGGNMDRPEFQRMLNDAKNNLFNMLICYRLDRVSRNIADFANTYQLLQDHTIEFVSVKEQFDTSTPIGRAMLNIAMVFAQLERETIAERIRDNMLSLARTGRWLGGTTPTGFISQPIDYIDHNMNNKKMYQLIANADELEKIQLIFNKFSEMKSLRGTESYLSINNVLTKNNCNYTADTIKSILTNPVYAAADKEMYYYLLDLGCDICNIESEFNGKYGLMVYNKTKQAGKMPVLNNFSDWIVAIANHSPVIKGSEWLAIQELLQSNASKGFYTKPTMQYGLLTNLIKCACCGSNLKIKKGKISTDGKMAYTYVCSTKEISRRTQCNVKNVIGQDADKDVLDYLISLAQDDSLIMSTLSTNQLTLSQSISDNSQRINEIETSLKDNENAITNLMNQLSKLSSDDMTLSPHFMKQLKGLDEDNAAIKEELKKLTSNKNNDQLSGLNLDLVRKALLDLKFLSTTDDILVQRALVRTVIEKITWDGESLVVVLFGQKRTEMLNDNVTPPNLCRDSKCNPYGRGSYSICYAK